MTRLLSHLLQAPEPAFRLGLQRLEAANGNPSADIRVSSAVHQIGLGKLRQLGLDPFDTTPQELYRVLQEKVKTDDAKLTKTLRTLAATHVSAEADVVGGMVHAINGLKDSKRCYALKTSSLKGLIKKNPPKRALKKLGYRSLESCLKHEAPLNIMAAAWLAEGRAWQQRLVGSYKQLSPQDFEDRRITVVKADFKRWPNVSDEVVTREGCNLLSFREFGALVFLPLPNDVPPGVVTASLGLGLHELNEIRAASSFLKLYRVRSDFGEAVVSVAVDEPHLSSGLLDRPTPWRLVHRYYANTGEKTARGRGDVFEPHLRLEDIAWHPIEKAISAIEPGLDFWHGSTHAGILHEHKPVSLNIIDAALNCCNNLPFEKRTARFLQSSLWQELMLHYLKNDSIEQSLANELQPRLAEEMVEVQP